MTISISTEYKLNISSSINNNNNMHQITTRYNNISNSTNNNGIERMTPLPCSFSPGLFDVICARGKDAKNHPGNKHFRSIVKQSVEKYSQATTRIEKSKVVSDIVDTVRCKTPNGGFIKEEQGQWYEVGDHLAREKVGQSLRDLLHGQYKSSTKAKRQRRQELDSKIREDLEVIIQANELVSQRMNQLSHTIQMQGPHVSDFILTSIMTKTNCDLLNSFKNDESLKKKFRD